MVSADPKCVYVLYGSDAFLRDETRRALVQRIIGDADPQTAVTHFDATAELAEVLDELRTLPFLAPRRAVILSDADAFVTAHRGALEKYLDSPSSASSLILIVASWPTRARLYKMVNAIGEAIDCSAPDQRKLVPWIRKAAERRGKKIAPDAVELLLEWRGADLAALDGELEKLSLYVGERDSISADDVSALVTATAGPEAFALANAITRGRTGDALKALGGSLTRSGDEFRTLGMIAWHLRKALHVQRLIEGGAREEEACKSGGVFYRGKREFLDMLRRRPLPVLRSDFRKLLAADLAMKTGTGATAAMQQLVVGLCS